MAADLFTPAPIAPPGPGSRPYWSVMIPTYNRRDYLAETIGSVLRQDPGPEAMQICVVDNATTTFPVDAMLRDLAGDRIEYVRHPANIGGIRNINACIGASRGRYVHVLHDDDIVLPGFYDAMADAVARHPAATLLLGPVLGIDAHGFVTGLALPPASRVGVMPDFLARQAIANVAPTQTVVVPRAVYEAIGGYAEALAFTPDWEFAFRAAAYGAAVTLGMPLAAARWHDGSDTSTLIRGTRHLEEMKATIDELVGRLSVDQLAGLPTARYRFLADAAAHYASLLVAPAERKARLANLGWAYRLDPGRRRLASLAKAAVHSATRRAGRK